MFYVFPLILPITKGNVVKTFIIGFVVLAIGLYFVTDLAPYFTKAAHDVYAKTQDAAVNIPSGLMGYFPFDLFIQMDWFRNFSTDNTILNGAEPSFHH